MIGTIPAGPLDDANDEGGISGRALTFLFADPKSHTFVE
jgi:hypothetical protein